jgi:DNA-binding transcriptional regulator YiaG
LTPKGAKIVAALERFRDAIEAGTPIEERYTLRQVKLDLAPRSFSPDEVRKVRSMLGVSQPIFGQFVGVDVKTVRSWEQGRRVSWAGSSSVPPARSKRDFAFPAWELGSPSAVE